MSTALRERPARPGTDASGGVPARRAVIRWAWRLLRGEWRQQLLVFALITVAVGATLVGAAVATTTPPPANAGFGTASDQATFLAPDPHLAGQIAALRHRFGRVDVIENQTVAVPGSVTTFDLRAQDPHGPYGQPMLSLVSGHYPANAGQVAVTSGVASAFGLKVGRTWRYGGLSRRVTGLVRNPQDLVDEFALVVPGQVTRPTQVTVLFDAPGTAPQRIGPTVRTAHSAVAGNALNPQTIVLALVTIGMLLIALVASAGFTVLAQRRLRSLGMLAAQGAADANLRLVVRANAMLVGVTGAVAGFVLGLAAWLAYRPILESSAHHVIAPFQLPWGVIAAAMVLAVAAAYLAAVRPGRMVTRIPVVEALSGRPAPPRQVHRSAVPGVIALAAAAVLLGVSGAASGHGGGLPELLFGLVGLVVAIVLLAPFCLSVLGRAGRRAPITARLALRDLARYRARSGSALAAISLGVLIAVLVCVLSAQRFSNMLDYAGPNLASDQILVYTPNGPYGSQGPGNGSAQPVTARQARSWAAAAQAIASGLGSHDLVRLETTSATVVRNASGRQFAGPVYVATPQLLRAFGIKASAVNPAADILTMRPGLSGLSRMELIYGNYFARSGPPPRASSASPYPCPAGDCRANPVIQQVGALPPGTSAPNTVLTEHAVHELGLTPSTSGWLIQAPRPPTAAQISNARLAAAAGGLTIETRNSIPTSATIINWATVFGIVLALAILAMSVGLIRSETAADLRTLAATGAGATARRSLTAVTAGALGLLGAVLGTATAYVGVVGYAWDNKNDGVSALSAVPVTNLLLILVGMPLIAAVGGWLLAGREPAGVGRQPMA